MSGYPCLVLISDTLSCFLQRFLRQQAEDGDDPSANWGADLPILATEAEDPDDEDNLPIPDAKQPASAKTRASPSGKKPVRASPSIRDWSEDDDDDCRILDPIDAVLVSYAYPLPSGPANLAGQDKKSRKRAGAGASAAGTSTASDPDSGRPRKQQKKAAGRKPKKAPPTMAG